jgi:hypothetical protein
VVLSLITEFENFSVFKPGDYNLPALNTMLDQVVDWSCLLSGPGLGVRAQPCLGDRRGPPSAVLCDWGRSASTRPQGARTATRHCQRSSLGRRKDPPRAAATSPS